MNYELKQTMMHRLTQLGTTILIGLSSILLTGCPGNPFAIDPVETKCLEVFKNLSEYDISIILIDTIILDNKTSYFIISGQSEESRIGFPFQEDAKKEYIGDLNRNPYIKIRLIVDEKIKKEWIGPAGHYGDTINSPFNYDSWVYEALEPDANNVVGKITFTITDKDLE